MGTLEVDKLDPQSGTALEIGTFGDTVTVPSGVTLTVAGALNVTGTTALADGTVNVAELDIDGATDIGEAIVDADLFVIDNGAGGTNRKTAASRLTTYILGANSIDSDMYVDGSIDLAHMSVNSIDSDQYVDGSIDTAHIGALQVTGAKLAADVISAQTALTAEPADTDEFMVSDAGVLKRIDYSLIKGGGITHAQIWNMNTAFTGGGNPLSSNWAETWTNDIGDANSLGSSSVTQSSGIFTFGATGIWKVEFHIHFTDNGGVDKDVFAEIWKTENNSTYVSSSRAGAALYAAAGNSSARASALYDITDTTNQKVQFRNGSPESDTTTYGHGTYIQTYAVFIRLGDT